MRLDKFLKVSRLIKRRSVAKEVADQGRIDINDKTAKSSSKVAVGDTVTIHYGNRTVVTRVEKLQDSTKKDDAAEMYTILDTIYKESDQSELF
ncbi:RNA-binding S4 domain-containing protein [Aerococcaceae bacterium DSM 111022]|nr:RNA-binding S4 domain-containing protein [Aerococcaceae bacterium DSM 111022]